MNRQFPVVGVVSWSSDTGTEPEVFLADDMSGLRRAVAAFLFTHLPTGEPIDEYDDGEGSINYIDIDWVNEHPRPDLDDDAAVEQWLRDFKDATTDAWLDTYGPTVAEGETSSGAYDTYTDARTRHDTLV